MVLLTHINFTHSNDTNSFIAIRERIVQEQGLVARAEVRLLLTMRMLA